MLLGGVFFKSIFLQNVPGLYIHLLSFVSYRSLRLRYRIEIVSIIIPVCVTEFLKVYIIIPEAVGAFVSWE